MFGGSKAKAAVLAAGVAGITISGTVYGAGLKTDQQKKERVNKYRKAPAAELIAALEDRKGELNAKKFGLEKKMKEVEMRARGATRAESMVGRERRRPGE